MIPDPDAPDRQALTSREDALAPGIAASPPRVTRACPPALPAHTLPALA
jgi:hypothetical protein